MTEVAPARWIADLHRGVAKIAAGQTVSLSVVRAELDVAIDEFEAKLRQRDAITSSKGPGGSLG
jgi:hypothetical protein